MSDTIDSEYYSSTEEDVEYDSSSSTKTQKIKKETYQPPNNYIYRPISSIKNQYNNMPFYAYTRFGNDNPSFFENVMNPGKNENKYFGNFNNTTGYEYRNNGRNQDFNYNFFKPFNQPNNDYNPQINDQIGLNSFFPYQYIQPPENQEVKKEKSGILNRKRRKAAVKARQPTPVIEEDVDEYTENDEPEDIYEKLLKYDPENEKYFVKFRYKSYLHCDWVSKEEIGKTKSGLIKLKRYRVSNEYKPEKNDDKNTYYFDPDLIKIERIITIDRDEEGKKIFLIKWKKIPYEMSTFEFEEFITELEGFQEEFQNLKKRYTTRISKLIPGWRPSRDQFLKYDSSPVFENEHTLRSYQLEGLNWLLNRWYYRQGCILADEMGLGKTIQTVTFVSTIFSRYGYPGPVMIVAPLSTIIHWEREFKNWTNLRVLMFHGSQIARDLMFKYEFFSPSNNFLFDVLITTYEMVMGSSKQLADINFTVGIFDEAHRLKNSNSKAFITLKNLNFEHKILLSGTPLQNNLQELWSLLNFIDPARYNSLNYFLEEYKLENCDDVERLQNLLKPLMLRRMKDDVETIPIKEETIIEVELTMIQKKFYRAILEKNLEFLRERTENAPNLLNAMMELRKCCIHPYLIAGAEEKITKDIQISNIDDYYKILIQSSGKLVLLDKLLNKLNENHKVLIFSQMTRCLDLLADYLNYRQYKFERIDGGVRGDHRQAAIDRFSAEKDVFVFLLCTRAGGVGINLTSADTVVIFDSDWNPQNDLQAQARCHRIGQTNEVKIYRLVTRNTYEREMFDKASLKLGLDKAILQKSTFEGTKVTKKEAIEVLLKKGAYGVLMETDDISQKFCEEDIDQILERRTRIVKHTDSGNIFSKATFQVDEEIDDPFFWDNLLNKRKVEEDEGKIRRQVRRLAREGNLDDNVDFMLKSLNKELEGKVWNVEKVECVEDSVGFEDKKIIKNEKQEDENKNDEENKNEKVLKNEKKNSNNKKNKEKNVDKKILNNKKNDEEDDDNEKSIETQDSVDSSEIIKPHKSDFVAELETQVDTKDESKKEIINSTENKKYIYSVKPDDGVENLYLLIFFTVMKKGVNSLKSLPQVNDSNFILNHLISYCLEMVDIKIRDDFKLYMNYKTQILENKYLDEQKELYKIYYEKFLLRIQVVNILGNLLKNHKINLNDSNKKINEEIIFNSNDQRLINWVLSNGYDNYPTSVGSGGAFKGKNPNELNQKIRKIILNLNKKNTKPTESIEKLIYDFGRPTEFNKENLPNPEEIEKKIEEILKKRRTQRLENFKVMDLIKRINLFEKLKNLDEIPKIKKIQGLPKKWNKDRELVDTVLQKGITEEVMKIFNLSEDVVVKRLEMLVRDKKDD